MTETVSAKQPTRRIDLPRIFVTLFRPRGAFEAVKTETRSTWLTPMLVLSLTALLVVLVSGYLRTRAAMLGEIQLPPDWQYWTPQMQENFMQGQQLTQGTAFIYIIPLVSSWAGLWLGWLVLAGLLHLGSTLLGGRGSMQSALSVTAWASLPFALRDLLRAVYMLSAQHVIVSPGLSGFATGGGFAAQVLEYTDLFLLWNVVLLLIGFAIVEGLPRARSFLVVAAVMSLLVSIQAGAGALMARVSGGVVS